MSIRERDIISVCRWCRSDNLHGAEHGRLVPDGYESADIVCVWPCGHMLGRYERACPLCNPTDEPPF